MISFPFLFYRVMNDEQLIQLFTKQAEAQGKKIDANKIALMLKQNKNGYRNSFMNMVLSNETKNQPAVNPAETAKAAVSNQQNLKMVEAVKAVTPVDPIAKVAEWKAKWAANNKDLYNRVAETDKMVADWKDKQKAVTVKKEIKKVDDQVINKPPTPASGDNKVEQYFNRANPTNFSSDNTNAVNETVNTTQEKVSEAPTGFEHTPGSKGQVNLNTYGEKGQGFFAWLRGLRNKYANRQLFKDGGKITPEDMYIGYLLQLSGAANEQELQQWIMAQGEEQMKQHYLDFVELMSQNQKTQTMKNGAKLNYIKQLKGICPEGYEMAYFAEGGSMVKKCKKCEQGAIPARPIKGQKGTEVVKGIKADMASKKQEAKKDSTYTKAHYDKDVKDFQKNGYKFKDKAHQDRVQKWNQKNPTELESHKCGGKKLMKKK